MYMRHAPPKYIHCLLTSNHDCENPLLPTLLKLYLTLGNVFTVLDFFAVIYVLIRNFEKAKLNI